MSTLELLDRPLGDLLLWFVLKGLSLDALWQLESHILGRSWHWEFDTDLCRKVVLRELGAYFHREAQSVACIFVNERVDTEGSRVLSINSIVHD